jgi:hypothetical protein
MTEWIKCSTKMPPKQEKFLFHYDFGTGLGDWGQTYEIINGNSERRDERYILILWPSEVLESSMNIFEWNEEKMIEMEVYWQPLPIPPKDESC